MNLNSEESRVYKVFIESNSRPISVVEIAPRANMQHNTVHRVIGQLVEKGYLNPDNRKMVYKDGKKWMTYWIGPEDEVKEEIVFAGAGCAGKLPSGKECGSYYRRGNKCNICGRPRRILPNITKNFKPRPFQTTNC